VGADGWVNTLSAEPFSRRGSTNPATSLPSTGPWEKGDGNMDRVSHCIFGIMVEMLMAKGFLILMVVYDTLNKYRGKRICSAGRQHDGSVAKQAKQKGCGVCFVVIGVGSAFSESAIESFARRTLRACGGRTKRSLDLENFFRGQRNQ
jgi:hypothetical protein